jgi:hypothetical protein
MAELQRLLREVVVVDTRPHEFVQAEADGPGAGLEPGGPEEMERFFDSERWRR